MWDGWLSIEWHHQQEQLWKQFWLHKLRKHWTSETIKKLWNEGGAS